MSKTMNMNMSEVRAKIESGLSVSAIAKEYKIPRSSLYREMDKAGIAYKEIQKRIDDNNLKEISDIIKPLSHLPVIEIMKLTGLSRFKINRAAERCNIKFPVATLDKDITDDRFGSVTAIRQLGRKRGATWWLCKCDCGNLFESTQGNLSQGRSKSCGCKVGRKPRNPNNPENWK
jgi:hypothetical protein